MTLNLYFHPLSSFCHKALIALYEHDALFERITVDLGNADALAAFAAIWPLKKFPVLRDDARGHTIAESSAIVAYVDTFYRRSAPLIPADPDLAWQAHMWDQFCDNYLQVPMQKIVGDNFRPEGGHDPVGCAQARGLIQQCYDVLEQQLGAGVWMLGDTFTLADCAAAPALFYADLVAPIGPDTPRVCAYLDRLMAQRSCARVLREAEPYFPLYPGTPKPSVPRR